MSVFEPWSDSEGLGKVQGTVHVAAEAASTWRSAVTADAKKRLTGSRRKEP